ncbi:MAG: hypothetical protein J0L96_01940 [Anaerolineae bacterium]|nr:hypothetical protein [Anaerolineae bacterium]
MNPWLAGLSALAEHAWAACAVLFIIAWGFFVARASLLHFFEDSLTEAEVLSISAAGWVIPVLILSLLTLFVSLLFNAIVGGIVAIIVILFIFWLFRNKRTSSHLLIFISLLIPTLILRFAFLADQVLPSYFDSAEHYRLIHLLTESYQTGNLSYGLTSLYYHLGFHSLSAFISYFFQVEIIDLMLVIGPILLTFLPFSFYFILKRETNSTVAAFFSCLVAGFGFHMPAHVLNWGKYPALVGMLAMLVVFNLTYLLYRNDIFKHRRAIFIFLIIAIPVSVFIHSRTLVVYGLLCITFLITASWCRLRASYRLVSFILPISLLVIEFFAIQNNFVLKTLLDTYLTKDLWMLVLLLPLTITAAMVYPKPTFFLLTWLALCILCMFIPIVIPVHGIQTLLDRPFVQMFSIVPLALLGGFGLAGLTQWTQRFQLKPNLIQRFMHVSIVGLVLLNAALTYQFYPSACCRFASRDDLAAFTWLEQNLPADVNILIPSSVLSVTSKETTQSLTGVDAAIWITPLTSRKTTFAPQATQFTQPEIYQQLCIQGITHIYSGGMPESFKPIQENPAEYTIAFLLPQAGIYALTGCR